MAGLSAFMNINRRKRQTMQSVTQISRGSDANRKNEGAKIGQHLIKVKEGLPRGEFTDWIEDNCNFSIATARRYMSAARAKDSNPKEYGFCETINDAATVGYNLNKQQTLIQRIAYNLGLMLSRFPISS